MSKRSDNEAWGLVSACLAHSGKDFEKLVARKASSWDVPYDDLWSEGVWELFTAAKRLDWAKVPPGFDSEKHDPLWAYAKRGVEGRISRVWRVRNQFSGTSSEADATYQYRKAEAAMATELGRWPDPEEVADRIAPRLGMPAERVMELVWLRDSGVVRLDEPHESDETDADMPLEVPQRRREDTPHGAAMGTLRRQVVEQALAELPADMRDVVEFRFGLHTDCQHTYEQTGRRFGLSATQVMITIKRALEMLQRSIGEGSAWLT